MVIASGATVTADNLAGFTATSGTSNNSTNAGNATLTAKADAAVTIDLSSANGSTKGFTIEGGSGSGNDALTGSAGADIITGGAQVDTIIGGAEVDTITGGACLLYTSDAADE